MYTPKTLLEAVTYYSDMDNCIELMISLRWADGVTCPRCESKDTPYLAKYQRWQCKGCRKQFTAKVGTVMEDSPLGLDKWLMAIWMICNCKNGVSSYEIGRAIGVSQKTAWFLLHRIRHAMNNGTFEKLSGTIEADETLIGGLEKNKHERKKLHAGTGATGKAIVAGVVQRGGDVSAIVIPKANNKHLQNNLSAKVEAGSVVMTDSNKGYNGLNEEYIHAAVDHAVQYVQGSIHTNTMECFWNLLKRTLRGTYVSCDVAHLPAYLDEQCYRFNERKSNDSGRFLKATAQTTGKRLTWKDLVDGHEGR